MRKPQEGISNPTYRLGPQGKANKRQRYLHRRILALEEFALKYAHTHSAVAPMVVVPPTDA